MIAAENLGSARFRAAYGVRYAYLAGSMYKGIASSELLIALGRAGFLGFLGTGGLEPRRVEADVRQVQAALGADGPYGVNLLCNLRHPDNERRTAELLANLGVRHVEAAGYTRVTPSLVFLRLKGIQVAACGELSVPRRVVAKVSRPEVAAAFMAPPPARLVCDLVAAGQLSEREAQLGEFLPMAHEICVESDSGGHTDAGVAGVLFPTMLALRDEASARFSYAEPIQVGSAGGIGTPRAAAAAFAMGADFIVTGSINQCTVEAGTSEAVKDMLQTMDITDTAHVPAGDQFEIGSQVQVLKKGSFFAARALRLQQLYRTHESVEEIDPRTIRYLEEEVFRRSLGEVWKETQAYCARHDPQGLERMQADPKRRMAAVFKWYFFNAARLALEGVREQSTDFQIHCGPALGAFNRWVHDTPLQPWRNRFVADLAARIMNGAAEILSERYAELLGPLPMTTNGAVMSRTTCSASRTR